MHSFHDYQLKDNPMMCEHIDTCSIIRHMNNIVPFTTNMTKIKYCEFNKIKCARYRLSQFLGIEIIPGNLWPGDDIKALELSELKLNKTRPANRS